MTKTLLTVDHTPPQSFGVRVVRDIREVEAYVVGGLEGVFAIYRIDEEPDVYYFASGDDGNWWRTNNGLHSDWLKGVYVALAECMLDREGLPRHLTREGGLLGATEEYLRNV